MSVSKRQQFFKLAFATTQLRNDFTNLTAQKLVIDHEFSFIPNERVVL